MALYRSKMITDRGEKAVLLMWGRLLSQYTAQAVEDLEISGVVHPFYSWWARFCRKQWGVAPEIERYVFDWPAVIDLYLERQFASDVLPYLLIDEGQDLPRTFFVFARELATELTVFADENQRITENNSTLHDIRTSIRPDDVLELKRNYRNTVPIAKVAAHFYTDGPSGIPDPPTRSGPPVQLRRFPDLSTAAVQVANLAKTDRRQQIGVFVPTRDLVTRYVHALCEQGVEAQWYTSAQRASVDFSEPGVVVTTWASAKGLEFDTVFVAELHANWIALDNPTLNMQLYVLASRARERLVFTYTGVGTPGILSLLPHDDLEHVQ
jgi:DNA helicase IV